MTSHYQKISLATLLGLVIFLGFFGAANAQQVISFSVSPTIFDMTANPGQTWKTSVRIINPNSFDLQLYADAVNFVPREESGIPEFIPVEEFPGEKKSFASWVQLPETILVPAQRTVELPVVVSVPEDGDPGGHFAAILIGTKPPVDANSDSGVSTAQIISSLLFLRVTGDISEIASIRSFRSASAILEKPKTTFEIRVENKGNVHVQPQGEIVIYNMWGQERGVVSVNQKKLFGNVLPKSIRKYQFDWESEWSIADIGRYTAKVVLTYGNTSKQSLVAETSFWVIPWKWVLLTLSILALFVYGFVTAIKLYIRKVLALSGVSEFTRPMEKSTTLTPKTKPLNIAAPIEMGMLDLRSKLSKSAGFKEKTIVYLLFVKQYRIFFLSIIGVVVFVSMLVWYFGEGSRERSFTVTNESGEVVSTDAEKPKAKTVTGTKQNIQVVNRSGSKEAAKIFEEKAEAAGYAINDIVEEKGLSDSRTVIVFSPSLTDIALKLSSLLKNAPLSALPESSDDDPEITIFLGSDASTE